MDSFARHAPPSAHAAGFSPFAPADTCPATPASRIRRWGDVAVYDHDLPALEVPEHLVGGHQLDIHLGPAARLHIRQDGRWRAATFRRGEAIYTPPTVWCGGHWAEPRRVVIVSFGAGYLRALAADGEGAAPAPRFRMTDPLVAALGAALSGHLAEPAPNADADRLYGESLATALAAHLVARGAGAGRRPHAGGLAPAVLRRVTEYLDAHVPDPVRLTDVAAVAGLNAAHLCRAFKQSAGRTLFAYLGERRVAWAADLLVRSALPLSEVALAAGFASQAHLTDRFRRATGTTPGAYRRAYRPVNAPVH